MHYKHSLTSGLSIRYEHTITAILSMFLGIFLLVEFFLVTFVGVHWLLGYPTFAGSLLYLYLIRWGFILGPVFIALGIVGIKRELWVRELEHRARQK